MARAMNGTRPLFPADSATLADWVADVLGSIGGVLGVYLYYKKK